jgi:tetratricopeptide (TPR) repeat protein
MQYKRTKKSLPQIARELNVDAAVEGTVLRSGGQVRITAQLLQARTDRLLWAETYERDFETVIQLERQMALAIAHESQLTLADHTRSASTRTQSQGAFDAHLRGRYLWNQRDAQATAEAVGYFQQALREDPNFALAWAGLSDCYSVGWSKGLDFSRAPTSTDSATRYDQLDRSSRAARALARKATATASIETSKPAAARMVAPVETDPLPPTMTCGSSETLPSIVIA